MSIHVQVCCDGSHCAVDEDLVYHQTKGNRERVRLVRSRLKARGWQVGLPGGRDLCPDCARREGE